MDRGQVTRPQVEYRVEYQIEYRILGEFLSKKDGQKHEYLGSI